MDELRLHHRQVKTALRRGDLVDSYFVGKYTFSPYRGCAHGCVYCDGRAERYYVEGEFDRDVVVRNNIGESLDHSLRKARERGIVFIGSGVSDAYQPPEAAQGLMRTCARVLADRGLPVTLLTKSALPLRDLDLWEEVARKAGFLFMVSLSTLDEEVRTDFEPGAASIQERLDALAAFKSRGCATGVAAMPFLPGVSEGEDRIRALAERLASIGVDFVLSGGLTLRPGRQKDHFLDRLRTVRPDLLARYEWLYGENRASGAPRRTKEDRIDASAERIFLEAGLPIRIPHAIYRNRLPLYDEVHVLVQHLGDLYAARGRHVQRLRAAQARYDRWLLGRKRVFNRRRSMTPGVIEWELREMAQDGRLAEFLDNARLAEFLRRVILERKVFDYRGLRYEGDEET